jgi:CheY-like chemotaxis protein
MSDSPEEKQTYLSCLHLREIKAILKDIQSFIDRPLVLKNVTQLDGDPIAGVCKRKFVVGTFKLTGDLSFGEDESKKELAESDRLFALAFSLDMALILSAQMLGTDEETLKTHLAEEKFDTDTQEACQEIFTLATGGLESALSEILKMSLRCEAVKTEMMDFSQVPFPDLGSPVRVLLQDMSIGEWDNGKIIQLMPENLGFFLRGFMETTIEIDQAKKVVSETTEISVDGDKKSREKNRVVKRVMVVDDTYLIRQLISKHLRDFGYAVCERADGVSAVKRAYLMGPSLSLVILDLKLPDMEGFSVLKELKKNERTKHLKVIMCSSSNDKDDVLRSFKEGALDYIVKPFNQEVIIGKVVKAIGRPD